VASIKNQTCIWVTVNERRTAGIEAKQNSKAIEFSAKSTSSITLFYNA
jgi:hypothetical protein